jgi:tetratricopeptide (TPR) repeat protein
MPGPIRAFFATTAMAVAGLAPAQGLIAQGDALLAAGRQAAALDKYDAAVDSSANAISWTARAKALLAIGKDKKALQDLNSALAMDSLYLPANRLSAEVAFRKGDDAGTIHFADRALEGHNAPVDRARLLVMRGQSLAALQHNKQALADLAEGLEGRNNDLPAMKTLARLYDLNGQFAESLGVLETLCSLEPEDIGNWCNRGHELNRLGRFAEALSVLETALRLDKDEPVTLSNKAFALMRSSRDADAMEAVNRSLRSNPENPVALCTRAELLIRRGDRDKACADLRAAKALGSAPGLEELTKENCGP